MVQMKFDINILTKCFSLTIWISYLSGLMISFHVSAVLYRFIICKQFNRDLIALVLLFFSECVNQRTV